MNNFYIRDFSLCFSDKLFRVSSIYFCKLTLVLPLQLLKLKFSIISTVKLNIAVVHNKTTYDEPESYKLSNATASIVLALKTARELGLENNIGLWEQI